MVSARVKKKGRRAPVQARSRETVELILQATAQLLEKEGYEKLSTNRVAKKAGVSVGSLYQYFPSKEAILVELIERHIQEMSQLVKARLTEHSGLSVRQTVRSVVSALVEAKRIDPGLHKVFIEQVPRLGQLEKVLDINRRLVDLIQLILASRPEPIRPKNLDLAAFILVHAVQSITHALAISRPANLDEDALIEEVTDMVVMYVLGPTRGQGAD